MESYYIDYIGKFDLEKTFLCGQAFRWRKIEDKNFLGIISNNVYQIQDIGENRLYIETTAQNSQEFLKEYLALNQDYEKMDMELSKNALLKTAVEYSKGIRILNQARFECLISYIISANNMVPRISKSVNEISKKFGQKIEFKGDEYFSFPTPYELSKATEQDLRDAGVGFRDKYIIDTVKNIINGEIDLDKIENFNTDELRSELVKFKGVGRKVADCVMLYSYHRYGVFPIDVWIKRVMESVFLDGKETKNLNEIQKFANEQFGELAGLANIYLFYYARDNKIYSKKQIIM